MVDFFVPKGPVRISDAHSVNAIVAEGAKGEKVRFGGGNRHTPKTVAVGNVDLAADIAEIEAGMRAGA